MVAQVIVDVIHTKVARPFTYLIPEGMKLSVGHRVLVPLGKRQVDGFVTEISDTIPSDIPMEKMKFISQTLDDEPALLPSLIELAREIAADAHCPLAEALRLMIPSAMRVGRIREKKEACACLAKGVDAGIEADRQGRSVKRSMLLKLLADGEIHSISELSVLVNEPKAALKNLEARGLVLLSQREVFRIPETSKNVPPTYPPEHTADQKEALEVMLPALEQGKDKFLLHGVTGSGKTEVYLSMVEHTLSNGKGAIILVPEIALTPQMVRWFVSRFGPSTAVLHSRLTDGQRYDEWRRIRHGQARVVVGARSAVFAPVEKLGLVVIDEEHEQSYISDKYPRYDARRIAESRAAREGATVVLSSATPSILSFARARKGDFTLVEMPRRVGGRPLPQVEIVDMRREMEAGNRSLFSRTLASKLKDCVSKGEQAMLFLNRRGYNTFVSCRSCGYVVKCSQCDLSMTFHRTSEEDEGILRCHMCGQELKPPSKCPECGSRYIRYFGSGTQRVEEEVHKLLPNVTTVRMDIDTTRGRDSHAKLLDRFGSGEAQVLIGTQMIAKGLDFPKVTLVGVVAADLTLNLPDYRAPERTFQLITQVAGRAGRAQKTGEVVVQTYKPEEMCIQTAAAQDYRSFFESEFSRRRAGLYPPFTILARLLVESESECDAKQASEQLYNTVQTYLISHPEQKKRTLMVRAGEAPVKRIRGLFRYHVLFKVFDHPQTAPLLALLAELSAVPMERCQVCCEIDPVTLM